MFLAYFDDSAERGYVLFASVIVHDSDWLGLLDAWTDYRRWLRDSFGLPITKGNRRTRRPVELKATEIVSGSGPWHRLRTHPKQRMDAYRAGLRLIGRHASVFAVAWDPSRPISTQYQSRYHQTPALDCWRTALERLATFSKNHADHKDDRVMAIVDEGYGHQFAYLYRKMRRYHRVGSIVGGSLQADAPMFVDDPVVRDSRNAPFIQMADLCAYAALRELVARPHITGLWSSIGPGVLTAANRNMSNQPPGIKLMPP